MTQIMLQQPVLKKQENREILAHWDSLRGGSASPRRSSFSPMDLPRHLPHMIMLEPQLPARADIRIFGTELAHRLGYDLTGQNMVELYKSERNSLVLEFLSLVVEKQVVTVTYTTWTTPAGHKFMTENIWLPLTSEEGKVSRILGSLWELAPIDDDMVSLGESLDEAEKLSERSYYKF
ncbi:PAS domain-containing protein [Pyruvatibacter sp. HU-CL02332]|uniref:PAS domain-containing protein n=1 Tax=Pyruvatibacter sp. HU-CL02332 TaxID=3127650 RepID=UPI00336564E9